MNEIDSDRPLSVIIVGASGDLARKKLLPALFALYSQGYLPDKFNILGFARSPLSDDEFRRKIAEHLTCRYVPEHDCEQKMDEFLSRCHYVQGQYKSADSFLDLYQAMKPLEGGEEVNRLYYLAIPPSIFIDVARAMGGAGLVNCGSGEAWSRVIIEKPFGSDRESSDEMARELAEGFPERDIYRIDHYLGKEIVQNLLALRFANAIFEPLWNRDHIDNIQITWKENIGIESRAGYFNQYGIIRDVVQNHLMQILALVAMDEPSAMNAQAVRDEKVKVLRSIPPIKLDEVVVGQYAGDGKKKHSYMEEEGVPEDSVTPTYTATVLHINNERWKGVPFFIRAGKGLDRRVNEIHIQFKEKAKNIFESVAPKLPRNQLVIRVQPDEAIDFRIVNKVPGLKLELEQSALDLRYATTFDTVIPEGYEVLILDAILGDKSLFIRNDELAAAWDIYTPVLHELENKKAKPAQYTFGSNGPEEADKFIEQWDTEWQ